LIRLEQLTKRYGALTAVDALSLEIQPGEMFGLLGPNGAGKTTTIRMLTGLTRPTSGTAKVGGYDVARQPMQARALLGVVQQHLSLDRELAVWEVLELHGRLRGMPRAERRQRTAELLSYVGLSDQTRRRVDELSGGTKRRLMIARALMHRPRCLILDEPTIGLDPQTRRRIWELVRLLNAQGATILLTTHYIEEAEALCHRVGIIDHGRLIALGTPLDLRERLGLVTVEVRTLEGTHYAHLQDHRAASEYVQQLVPAPQGLLIRDSNLEDVFVDLTGRKVLE
jgi:ABC-2 type transport system ATP-binding protein